MIENNLINQIVYYIMKILNILIVMPLVLAFGLVILALCLTETLLLLSIILMFFNIFIPIAFINLGTSNFIIKLIVLAISLVVSYYLYKFLKIYVPEYFNFLGVYLKRSFIFKFNI